MDSVTIEIRKEIENCTECPLTEHIYEHGFCGTICTELEQIIPDEDILEDCPFRNIEEL